MGFHMWYPTDYQLKLFEGDWVKAPEYVTGQSNDDGEDETLQDLFE